MSEKLENKDVVYLLAKNVVATSYSNLPKETVDVTKKSIIDTLGVIIGASGTMSSVKPIVDLVKEAGGKEESTILGFGGKVPAWMAAFVNGALAHCLDYEDLNHKAGGHPSAGTVPAGFATAERLGNVSGKEFITAITLGNDLFCRLSYSVTRHAIWHKSPVFGVFAAAATSGKLLGLGEEKMVNALGLAFCQAAGTMELRWGIGSDIGGMRDAFPNKAGVLSALMAQRGVVGIRNSLESRGGLYKVYFGGKYDRNELTADLGRKFEGSEVGFKPWPACGETHVYIDATLAIVQEHDIHPDDIEEVIISVGDAPRPLCQPLEVRRKPTTTLDAKYSLPFTVAVAIVRRKVVIEDFTPDGLKDEAVLTLAQKVTPKYDPEFDVEKSLAPGRAPGKVEIKTKDGKLYSKRSDFPYGHPAKPMTWTDIIAKFKDCLTYSAKPVPKGNMEKVIYMVSKLEDEDDIGQIVRLLA